MTRGATDTSKELLAVPDSAFDLGVVRDDTARNSHGRLVERNGGDIGASELVFEAVAIGICIQPEALGGLHAVVLVKGRIREFTKRHDVTRLVPRTDDQVGAIDGRRSDDAG